MGDRCRIAASGASNLECSNESGKPTSMSTAPQFKSIYLAKRNPSVRAEDWPRTWRSHAAYAAQFPVIYSDFSSIYYCARVLQPSSNGVPVDAPEASRDYDGVAL